MTSLFRLTPPPRLSAMALAAALSVGATQAHADERADLEQLRATTLSLMQALIDNGLLSREKADDILRQARKAAPAVASADAPKDAGKDASSTPAEPVKPKTIRVPYVTDAVKAEMREQIKQEVLAQAHDERWGDPGALPHWLHSISVEGDLRVRFQNDLFSKNNTAIDDVQGYGAQTSSGAYLGWATDLTNTQVNRDRSTLRGRMGIKSQLGDGWSAGLRLSTGSGSSPVGASQTQGNSLNKYSAYFDQAYLRYDLEGKASAVAGRFASPFLGTDLTWPDDLNFDGVALSYKPVLGTGHTGFVTVGAFPLQELETSHRDKWLYGAQIGTALTLAPQVLFRAGLAQYDFHNIEGLSDTGTGSTDALRPNLSSAYPSTARQKGNTLFRINNGPSDATASTWGLASKFKPVDLTLDVAFLQFFPVTVKVSLDYIKNVGFDLSDIRSRAGGILDTYPIANKTSATQLKLNVGYDRIDRAGQWQGFLAFRRFERDAWVDAYTDTTWHLGGTNYQGWSIGGQYGVGPRTSLGMRWTSTRNLSDTTLYTDGTNSFTGFSNATLKIDVLQVELNTRF
jgi:hypothetical protein